MQCNIKTLELNMPRNIFVTAVSIAQSKLKMLQDMLISVVLHWAMPHNFSCTSTTIWQDKLQEIWKLPGEFYRAKEDFRNGPLTVLDFLAISRRFLQGSDDKWWGTWYNWHLGLSVLDCQLNCDSQSLPVLCCLGDVISNFFGRLKYL